MDERKIKLDGQRKSLRAARGAWADKNHPELSEGAAKWIREIRQDSLKRIEKIERRRNTH